MRLAALVALQSVIIAMPLWGYLEVDDFHLHRFIITVVLRDEFKVGDQRVDALPEVGVATGGVVVPGVPVGLRERPLACSSYLSGGLVVVEGIDLLNVLEAQLVEFLRILSHCWQSFIPPDWRDLKLLIFLLRRALQESRPLSDESGVAHELAEHLLCSLNAFFSVRTLLVRQQPKESLMPFPH